jgi:RimJ/RimL family protein N-acetyltransferase
MAVNHGSRRVMEKIGMKHVRTDFPDFPARIPGAEEGEVWYELLCSEWNGLEQRNSNQRTEPHV